MNSHVNCQRQGVKYIHDYFFTLLHGVLAVLVVLQLVGCSSSGGNDGLTALVAVTDEPAGVNCANGGKLIETGMDDDNNGVLGSTEVDSSTYACNGIDGLNALVSVSTEPAGTNCPSGGKLIETGQDDNNNGILDPAEVDSTDYVCGLSRITSIEAGGVHSLVIKDDGMVWAWGDISYNLLGSSALITTSYSPSPITICTNDSCSTHLDNVIAVSTSTWSHILALKKDGTVWAWGDNYWGQLGNGTTTDSAIPVQVCADPDCSEYFNNVVAIATGGEYSMALKTDGTVWIWGTGVEGGLGHGSTNRSSIPVQVCTDYACTGFLSGITAISSRFRHSLALMDDGTVWAWGLNAQGQLGAAETTVGRAYAAKVCGPGETAPCTSYLNDVTQISAGYDYSSVVRGDGSIWSWGNNSKGQLGDGTNTLLSSIPVKTNGSSYVAVSAGRIHTLALNSSGRVLSWGGNTYGQLGNGANTNSLVPVVVPGLSSVSSVHAGDWHSLAIKQDGSLWSWGRNNAGQLGNGAAIDSNIPVHVIMAP